MEEDWDAIDANQVTQDYASLTAPQVHFENANNETNNNITIRHDNRATTTNLVAHTVNKNDCEDNKITSQMESLATDNSPSIDDNPCVNKAYNNAWNNVYAYRYAVGHDAGSSSAYAHRYKAGYSTAITDKHSANLVFDDNNIDRYKSIEKYSNNCDY